MGPQGRIYRASSGYGPVGGGPLEAMGSGCPSFRALASCHAGAEGAFRGLGL